MMNSRCVFIAHTFLLLVSILCGSQISVTLTFYSLLNKADPGCVGFAEVVRTYIINYGIII